MDPDPESDLFACSDESTGDALGDNASAELPDNGIPVVIIEIDESEGHTINDMNSSIDHSVECYGTMEIKVLPDKSSYFPLSKHLIMPTLSVASAFHQLDLIPVGIIDKSEFHIRKR